jgi:pimeloyl-ACP methyl ester carboxylesterase
MDHPELISGLVLIDPTPVNSPKTMRMLGPLTQLLIGPTAFPVIGRPYERLLTRKGGQSTDELGRASLEVMIEHRGLYLTRKAIGSLPAEGAILTRRLAKLGVPVVLLTAERKATHEVRRAHEQLAEALGGRIVTWPGAVHGEHLRSPRGGVELVLSVAAEAATSR